MVSAHAARAQPIRPGRDVRAEHKFELPKLRATGSGGPYTAQCGLPYGTGLGTHVLLFYFARSQLA